MQTNVTFLTRRLMLEARTLISDISKDFFRKSKFSHANNKILINGLAKSGTSLVEHIFSELGYVNGARSLLRSGYKCQGYQDGFICKELFDSFPNNKNTFVKTHSVFNQEFMEFDKVKVIIILRDVKDALLSRYYHVMSDPLHWDNKRLSKIKSEQERFKQSVLALNPVYGFSQLEYYLFWKASWIHSPFQHNIFYYEDYKNSSSDFIQRLTEHCELIVDPLKIENTLENKRKSLSKVSKSLFNRRFVSGGDSGTFRKGLVGESERFFDAELNSLFSDLSEKYKI